MSASLKPALDQKMILAKAVLNAAEQLDIKQVQLAAILGVHRSTIKRLKVTPHLDPTSKQGELALLFIRIYRGLFALADGDADWMRHFMNTPNRVIGGIPVKQIESINGLVAVLEFVDSYKHKS